MNYIDFNILIVDRDPAVQPGMRWLLENAGYAVDVAASGDHALGLIEGKRPDLLLLDRDTANPSDLQLFREIRTMPELAECMVLMVWAAEAACDAQELEDIADGHIVRPVEGGELLALIESFVRMSQLSRELRRQAQSLRQSAEVIRLSQIEMLHLSHDVQAARDRREAILAELQRKNAELESFGRAAVDRELRMIELKAEVNALLRAAGREEKYIIV